MNQTTKDKIASAISKLGDVSYRKIATEAGVSLGMITRYYKAYTPDECIQQDNKEAYTSDERKAIDSSVGGYMEGIINTAKDKIKARGLFPTTPRLVEETGYTPEDIDTYFEERLVARRHKSSPGNVEDIPKGHE